MATAKAKTATDGDRTQAAALAAAFGGDEFTSTDAATVLYPKAKGPAANLSTGRTLKKLADLGLIDKTAKGYVAGTGPANAAPGEKADPKPKADSKAKVDPAPRTGRAAKPGPGMTLENEATPPMELTKAARKQILDANLPDGVGLAEKRAAAEDDDTLP